MTPQHIDIPALPSPSAVVNVVLLVCLIGGLSLIWAGVHSGGSRTENGGRDIKLGFVLLAVYLIGYWFLLEVIPYFGVVAKAVLH